jgi:hypothetical protein
VAEDVDSADYEYKRRDYQRYGVLEYLFVNVQDQRLHWIDLRVDRDVPMGPDGIVRAQTFPGLWVDSVALFQNDYNRLLATLQQGLASPEHAAFVQRLAAAGGGKAGS